MTQIYLLKLYLSSHQANRQEVVDAVSQWCDRWLGGQYELRVIDVMASPELAEQAEVLITPTLIRETPLPVKRLVGDLSNLSLLLPERHLNGNSSKP